MPSKYIGQQFGSLTVLSVVPGKGNRKMLCKCECGTVKPVRLNGNPGLLGGGSFARSCGCKQHEPTTKHNHASGGKRTPTYRSWECMRRRCTSPKDGAWELYGGRGISVCTRWNDFRNFLADMGERPPGMTIGRRDGDGNYEPDNCRWETDEEQANNQRHRAHILTHDGVSATVSEWSEFTGINFITILTRLHRGWSVERTLTT